MLKKFKCKGSANVHFVNSDCKVRKDKVITAAKSSHAFSGQNVDIYFAGFTTHKSNAFI